MHAKDTNREFIRNIEGTNGKLYRCINAGGTPYSYIEEPDGFEAVSAPTDGEAGMITFYINNRK